MTDASEDGWSGVLLPNTLWGEWPEEWRAQSMNWKELKAIHLSLTLFREELEGLKVSAVGQHNSPCMPEEAGFLGVPSLGGSNSGDLFSPGGSKYFDSPDSPEGKDQRPGGSRIQEGSHCNSGL